jgi:DNA polymerase-3 subunit chi
MADIRFYHLRTTPLDRALPKLLEKALEQSWRVVVLAGSAARVEQLDAALWTYDDASFLPHGTRADGNADRQPIWLTTEDENPNRATVLVAIDGARPAQPEAFTRCLDIFDDSEESVAAARARWRADKEAGHTLTYWQQTDRGGWEKRG